MPTFGWNYLNLGRPSFLPLTRRVAQITSSTADSPIWDTYIWSDGSLIVLPHVDWRKPKVVWKRETDENHNSSSNQKKNPNNLELTLPNKYLLLHVFHATDLFKLAICMWYIKQSFNKIQINRDCNPQNDLVEKTFALQVWLDALDVRAATLHSISEDWIYGLTSVEVRNHKKNEHADSHEKFVPNKALNHFMQLVIQTYLTVIQVVGIVFHTEKKSVYI